VAFLVEEKGVLGTGWSSGGVRFQSHLVFSLTDRQVHDLHKIISSAALTLGE
jgi:hypothetical protein